MLGCTEWTASTEEMLFLLPQWWDLSALYYNRLFFLTQMLSSCTYFSISIANCLPIEPSFQSSNINFYFYLDAHIGTALKDDCHCVNLTIFYLLNYFVIVLLCISFKITASPMYHFYFNVCICAHEHMPHVCECL